jgi:hypothetical protein
MTENARQHGSYGGRSVRSTCASIRRWPGSWTALIDELMRGLLAELRLVFHVMPRPHHFHQAYLARNREICELLEAGNVGAAEHALTAYLDDAERELLNAYWERAVGPKSRGDTGKALSH